MTAIILLFAMWPFSAKPKPLTERQRFEQGRAEAVRRWCVTQDEYFFFYGPDNMIGISKASCIEAFDEWNGLHVPPVPMSNA